MEDQLVKIDLERDLKQISKLVDQYIRDTYIQDIEKELEYCRKKCEHEESKEVTLLKAIAAFVPPEKQMPIGKMIEVMKHEKVIRQMLPKLVPKTETIKRSHEKLAKLSSHNFSNEGARGDFSQIVIALILYQILSRT
jgi:hypothetical protein